MKIIGLESKKNTVIVTFDNHNKVELNRDVLGEFYLYVNKILTDQELNNIIHFSEMVTHYRYVLRILSKNTYSEKEIRQKLYKRAVSLQTTDQIIKRLLEHKLVDDFSYSTNLYHYYLKQQYGPKMIQDKLERKGITEDIIERVVLTNEDEQYQVALKLAINFSQKQQKMAKSLLLNKIYSKLTRYGYTTSVAIQVLDHLKRNLVHDESGALAQDYQKIALRLKRKIADDQLLKEAIISKLMQKGYHYSDIKKYVEEQ